jgi:PTS system glucitol/sorbitol-specific IIA component
VTRYETTVLAVGPHVAELLDGGRLILFGEGAPAELHDLCALHRPSIVAGSVEPGDVVQIGDRRLIVTAVGDIANVNLEALGHITLRLGEPAAKPLPGEIMLAGPLPERIDAGTQIHIHGAD